MLQTHGLAPSADEVTARERAKYEDVWTRPEYRVKAHGLALWRGCREIFGDPKRAVDLGCGHGRLFAQWNREGIDGWGVDFAEAALDDKVRADWGHKFVLGCLWELDGWQAHFDLGVAADVMEHIPEDRVDRVLAGFAKRCDRVVMKIANFPSRSLGHDLHPTMKPAVWWQARIARTVRGSTVERLPLETGREEYLLDWTLRLPL